MTDLYIVCGVRTQGKLREAAQHRGTLEATVGELKARVETSQVTIKFYEDMIESERAKLAAQRETSIKEKDAERVALDQAAKMSERAVRLEADLKRAHAKFEVG